MSEIRKRSQIPVEDTWAIEDLYINDEVFEQSPSYPVYPMVEPDQLSLRTIFALTPSAKRHHQVCS